MPEPPIWRLREVRDDHVDPFIDDRFTEQAHAQPACAHEEAFQLLELEAERG
jgi:hypothetical protein